MQDLILQSLTIEPSRHNRFDHENYPATSFNFMVPAKEWISHNKQIQMNTGAQMEKQHEHTWRRKNRRVLNMMQPNAKRTRQKKLKKGQPTLM